MAKQLKRLPVPDPDQIEIKTPQNEINTDGLKRKQDVKPEAITYRKQFTQIRIERQVAEDFRQLCDEQDIRYYGNYINAVLKAYLDGALVNKK